MNYNNRKKSSSENDSVLKLSDDNGNTTIDSASINSFSYFNSNASIISYDSVLTTERLLDKLDLSQEDELLLQKVLEEQENEKLKKSPNSTSNDSRILCVPASQFPSLRIKLPQDINGQNQSNDSIKQLLEKDFTFKDKSLAAQVEQHYANTSRYSYIVEEDTNNLYDAVLDKFNNQNTQNYHDNRNMKNNMNLINGQYQPNKDDNRNVMKPLNNGSNNLYYKNNQIIIPNRNSNKLNNNNGVSNFERYRFENSRTSQYNPQMLKVNRHLANNTNIPQNNMNHQRAQYTYPQQYQQHQQKPLPRQNNVVNNVINHNIPHNYKNDVNHRYTYQNHQINNVLDRSRTSSSSPNENTNVSRNESIISKNIETSDSEYDSLGKYKTRTTTNTPMTSISNGRSDEYLNHSIVSTPKKDSLVTGSPHLSKEVLNERPPMHKAHKKKSSLSSFKNLFKTPKSKHSRSKEDLVGKVNLESGGKLRESPKKDSNSSLELKSASSSVENSPSIGKSSLRKFIFPPNPSFHFETARNSSSSSGNSTNGKDENNNNLTFSHHHYRSLSDMNKSSTKEKTSNISSPFGLQSPAIGLHSHKRSKSTQSGDTSLYLDTKNIVDLTKENDSLASTLSPDKSFEKKTSRNSPISISKSLQENLQKPVCLDSSPVERNLSQQTVQIIQEIDEGKEQPSESGVNNNLIATAINMRREGKLEASALKLKKACKSGNTTAYLLYGLALRHGCGTEMDLTSSLSYIQKATGITSFEDEVFKLDIDPFELESKNCIPSKLEEPLVPALHECGIAYLKGYGIKDVDEFKGLKFLEKAGSLGHVDSMCLCGIIWSQKCNERKKDIARAAVWFRLADRRGANLIGSEWIYKKKYLKKKTNVNN